MLQHTLRKERDLAGRGSSREGRRWPKHLRRLAQRDTRRLKEANIRPRKTKGEKLGGSGASI